MCVKCFVCCNMIALDQVGSFLRGIQAFVQFERFDFELPSTFVMVPCVM
jgi:hypothetical protein